MRPLLAAFLLACAVPLLTGCEGGCGEAEPKAASGASSGSGGQGGGPSHGSGQVAIERGEKPDQPLAKPEQKQLAAPASAGKGVADDGNTEYSAAGKPLRKELSKKLALTKLTAACRKQDPGCEDLRAAIALARKDWGARVVVEQPETAGPALSLSEGDAAVSSREGLPFAPKTGKGGEPLESSEDYRKRLKSWLSAAVKAMDLNVEPPAKPSGRGS